MATDAIEESRNNILFLKKINEIEEFIDWNLLSFFQK